MTGFAYDTAPRLNDVFPNAVCREMDPEIFFPEPSDPGEVAKSVCRRCEHRVACAAFAIKNHMEHGIWGGLTPDERKAIRRGYR